MELTVDKVLFSLNEPNYKQLLMNPLVDKLHKRQRYSMWGHSETVLLLHRLSTREHWQLSFSAVKCLEQYFNKQNWGDVSLGTAPLDTLGL